jgi:azurin
MSGIQRPRVIRDLAALAVLGALGAQAHAADKVCKLAIAGNDLMQYDQKELKVAADCTHVVVTLSHTGKLPKEVMGHDWVLVAADDVNAVVNAGLAAGLANGYLAAGDARVIAHTQIVGGGQSASADFALAALKKGVSYVYVCTFPGHSALMKGNFIVG